MILLAFAHKGEAREFIQRKHTIPVDFYFDGVFRNDNEILLITKEGIQSTTERMSSVCTYFGNKIEMAINLGIAGSLDKRLQVNQIYGINKIYVEPLLINDTRIFSTWQQNSKVDCITAFNPVLDDKYAKRLAKFANVVDGELWACASVCSLYKIPLKSYKLISDRAGSNTSLQGIKRKASVFSKHLFDFFKKLDMKK